MYRVNVLPTYRLFIYRLDTCLSRFENFTSTRINVAFAYLVITKTWSWSDREEAFERTFATLDLGDSLISLGSRRAICACACSEWDRRASGIRAGFQLDENSPRKSNRWSLGWFRWIRNESSTSFLLSHRTHEARFQPTMTNAARNRTFSLLDSSISLGWWETKHEEMEVEGGGEERRRENCREKVTRHGREKRKKEKRDGEKRRKDCNESRGRQTTVKLATSLFLLSLRRKTKTRRSFPSPFLRNTWSTTTIQGTWTWKLSSV